MKTLLFVLPLLVACGDKSDDTASSADGGAADGGAADGGAADGGAADGGAADGGGGDGGAAEAVIHEIDADTLAAWLDEEAAGSRELLLINTHVPDEGEIPGTDIHVAYNSGSELVDAVGSDLDRVTVVYCKSGPMSATAADTLVGEGYTGIYDLTGGMNAWEAAGYTLDE